VVKINKSVEKAKRLKGVILDFGGVISRTLFETHALTEVALGLPKSSLKWFGPFDSSSDSLWQSMQSDQISEREYWHKRTKEVADLIGADWDHMSDFVKAARSSEPLEIIRPEAILAIEYWKSNNIKLAVLSNELDLFYGDTFRDKLPFLDFFDIIHDATYTKMLKPDPRSYISCLNDLNLQPQDCLFIDDQLRNITGAQKIGLNTIHFNVLNPKESFSQALELSKF
jgi:putative hydrolase of the HAD superfamily